MTLPIPIMLIHGFNGSAADWESSDFRAFLIERGADPDLVRVFHYGWREIEGEEGRRLYNNQEDIRIVASRLVRRDTDDPEAAHSQLARLSEASVAKGGPARVTIIAHSMGGIVARYYLSRRTPDRWGTVNEGVVGRLITIASPHLGAEVTRVINLVPRDAFIWKALDWLEELPFVRGHPSEALAQLDAEVRAMQLNAQAAELPVSAQGIFDSPAVRQLVPGGAFMQALNAPGAFPEDVESAVLWGDVQFAATVRWGPLPLWARKVTLGDLLISAASASTIPNANPVRYPFVWGREFEIRLAESLFAPASFSAYLPPVQHGNLLSHPELREVVARLVGLP